MREFDSLDVEKFFNDHVATVSQAGSDKGALVQSTLPLRAADDDGVMKPVDPSLDQQDQHFESANPVVDVAYPDSAAKQVRLQDAGVGLTVDSADADSSVPTPFGDDKLFYHEIAKDTDLIVAPVTQGFELMTQIRSADSPERLPLTVSMPQGAELHEAADGQGIEVVRSGSRLALITAPVAVDAAGNSVPSHLSVTDGDHIELVTEHRSAQTSYPVLVDPVTEDWTNNSWQWQGNTNTIGWWNGSWAPGGYSTPFASFGCVAGYNCWGNGLYEQVGSGWQIGNGNGAQWVYTPHGASTYIKSANLSTINFSRNGENNWGTPYAYWGVYSTSDANWGHDGNGTSLVALSGSGLTNANWQAANLGAGDDVDEVVFGMGNNYPRVGSNKLTAARTASLGGLTIVLDDPDIPHFDGLTSTDSPHGWYRGNAPLTVHPTARDNGLGVKSVSLITPTSGNPSTDTHTVWCNGTYTARCPSAYSPTFSYSTANMPEGTNVVREQATDILGKTGNGNFWNVNVDRSGPLINLPDNSSDQLAQATDDTGTQQQSQDPDNPDELALPTYKLHVDATDASASGPRAGVANITVKLDPDSADGGQILTTQDQTCAGTTDSCPLSLDYTLNAISLSPGSHTVRIIATDRAGNTNKRDITFEFHPATGLTDDDVTQYSELPDGSDLAVNVMNGNLIYHHVDIQTDGPDSSLNVDRFYNSEAPNTSGDIANGWSTDAAPDVTATPVPPVGGDQATAATKVDDVSGSTETFQKVEQPGDQQFSPDAQATLTQTGPSQQAGDYTLQYDAIPNNFDDDGSPETMTFADGKVTQVQTPADGNAQNYSYDGQGELSSISTPDGLSANVSTTNGDISSISSQDVGTHTYSESGGCGSGNLCEYTGDAGTASYSYDSDGNLTHLSLPDGSTADISYDSLGRATQVDVHPSGGGEETTTYAYADRQTTVTEPDQRVTTYIIGNDGSVLKATSGANPVVSLGGSDPNDLTNFEGESVAEGSYPLQINAQAAQGIDRIEVYVDDSLMDSTACDSACSDFTETWTLDTGSYVGGDANIEVVAWASDGAYTSKRFVVTLPALPNPFETGELTPPSQDQAIQFRDDNNLNADPAYVAGSFTNPAFQVGLYQYGIPLNQDEVNQLRQDAQIESTMYQIDDWVNAHNLQGVYTGTYWDSAAGLVRVGFTQNMDGYLAQLALPGVFAYPDLLAPAISPEEALAALQATQNQIDADTDQLAQQGIPVTMTGLDIKHDKLIVGVDDLPSHPSAPSELQSRYGNRLDVQNKSLIATEEHAGSAMDEGCSAGYAAQSGWKVKIRGKFRRQYFVISAGHCGLTASHFHTNGHKIGSTWANYLGDHLDALFISASKDASGSDVQVGPGDRRRTQSVSNVDSTGAMVCESGAEIRFAKKQLPNTFNNCGNTTAINVNYRFKEGGQTYSVHHGTEAKLNSCTGDSGGPVWTKTPTGVRAIGIVSAGSGSSRPAPSVYAPGFNEQCSDHIVFVRIGAIQSDAFVTVRKSK